MEATSTPAAQPVLRLQNVSKSYGGGVMAVNNISLDVVEGEVLTLLGPSGCGKTTTLRMVIGLERATAGDIFYEGRPVDSVSSRVHVPTHKRNMGMVFQSYAIWPHMTVFENVAYPLRVRGIKGATLRDEVMQVIDVVGLTGFAERPATMLSGGQQQRVALARSLVFHPKLLLLDEPFSNLDAKLREQMRSEVKILQRRLGITVLFVTHDQLEALSLSDRIAVMHQGRIEQVGPPDELYLRPGSPIVRDFLGRTIIFPATSNGAGVTLNNGTAIACGLGSHPPAGSGCAIAIRPEHVVVTDGTPPNGAPNALPGRVVALLFIGDRYEAQVALPWGEEVMVYLPVDGNWREGQQVTLTLPQQYMRVWDSAVTAVPA